MSYLRHLGGALSRLANAGLLRGHPSESISGRCWRMRLERPHSRGWWRLCRAIDQLFFWDPGHCLGAYMDDVRYAEYRLDRHRRLMGGS